MAFNPNLPIELTLADAAQMRSQFNGLFDLIQTIPVGPQGPQGEPGPPGTSVSGAVVDGTSTLNPGDPATASAFFDGANVHFSFGIPRGNDGQQGQQGNDGQMGPQGLPGDTGPQGPAFTNFTVDGVTTLEPWQPATVQTSFDGTYVHFAFGIPRGNDGMQGPQGTPGNDGQPGPQGPPFTNFVVDSTSTLDPWQPAWVQTTFDGTWVRFSFGIPRGNDGPQGQPGQNGADGQPGQQGPPFTNFTVDATNTLQPGENAYVQTSYDGTFVRFSFGIPQGQQGNQGNNGFDGQPGQQGPQGPPFTSFVVDAVNTLPAGQPATVTANFNGTNVGFTFGIPQGAEGPQGIQGPPGPSDLSGTSNNTNGVATLDIPISDPPTQSEMQQMLAKMNELIMALRRPIP